MKKAKDIRILVVDDEPDILDVIQDIFSLFGFQTQSAKSGNEAWEILNQEEFDLVISDINMPDGDGLDLLKQIKERNFDFPRVLFITGFPDQNLSELYAEGLDGFFRKPFDASGVARAIQTYLMTQKERWTIVPVSEAKKKITLEDNSLSTGLVQLGRGGLFIESRDSDFTIGDTIDFDIQFADVKDVSQLEGTGRIKWIRKSETDDLRPGIGLEIIRLSSVFIEEVMDYLKQNKIIPFIPLGKK